MGRSSGRQRGGDEVQRPRGIEFAHVNGCMQGLLSLRSPMGPCLNLTRVPAAQVARGSQQGGYSPRMMDWPLVYQRQPNARIVWITEWRIEVAGNQMFSEQV